MDAKKVEVGCGDAISSLPDEILTQILCLLPTKLAASTPILSKRWRNLFSMMIRFYASEHHLQFDNSYFLYPNNQTSVDALRESFRAQVDSTLSLQQQGNNGNSSIKKLSLKCEDDFQYLCPHTNRWISNAVEQGVSDLDLRFKTPIISGEEGYQYKRLLPCSLFQSKTLVKLTLGTETCIGHTPLPMVVVSLPVLKSLFLHTVWFSNQDFCDLVLFGCPVLEELYIHHKYINHPRWLGPHDFCHNTIKRITIHLDYTVPHPRPRRLAFNTPNLTYLHYSDNALWVNYWTPNFLHSLLEARIDLAFPRRYPCEPEDYVKFFAWICNVQILFLSSATVELMCRCFDYWHSNGGFPLFENLVNLSFECKTKTKKGWKILWSMMKNSPKLENLILKGFHCIRNCGSRVDGNVVRVLELHGYRGTRREFAQVKRFLREIEVLEVMKVVVDAKVVDDNEKLQLTEDLLSLPRSSSKCLIYVL